MKAEIAFVGSSSKSHVSYFHPGNPTSFFRELCYHSQKREFCWVMIVLGKDKLKKFYDKHTNSKKALVAWLRDTSDSSWNSSHDIKNRYGSADFLSDNRVIFNIKGNNYRLVIKVRYQNGIAVILWIGTHAEYDKIDFRSNK